MKSPKKNPYPDHQILIVDDEPLDREYFVRVLTRHGFKVVEARNAEEAQQIMRRETFAVLLTDLWMPGLNGDELGRWAKEKFPALEVIIITAAGSLETASEAVRFGASDYLTKPVEGGSVVIESISWAVEKHLRSTRNTEQLQQLKAQTGSISEILDRLPQGVVLVTEDLRALKFNRIAKQILQDQDGLQLNGDKRLVSARSDDTATLRRLVQEASRPRGSNPTGGAMNVQRPSHKAPLSLMVTPLDNTMETAELGEPVVSIFVSDPDHQLPRVGMLSKLYGMTPTEATLARHLARGKSMEQAGDTMGIQPSTVRTHLKHIFRKTNTQRQVDLVRLLITGPAALTHEGDDEGDLD